MKTGSKQRKFENFILFCWGSLFGGDFGVQAGTITFGTLLSVTLRHVMICCITTRYVTLRYNTFTLLDVTVNCITVVFNAFSFAFTVENKKQREQDRTSDERQRSEKPSSVVYWSFFIWPGSWRKKKYMFWFSYKKILKQEFCTKKQQRKIEWDVILTGCVIAFKDL